MLTPACDANGCSDATIPWRVMIIERPWVRPSSSAAAENWAAVSITKKTLAVSKCNALPRQLPPAEQSRKVRKAGIGNIEFAAGVTLIGLLRECNSL
jgi:hypothetical protein